MKLNRHRLLVDADGVLFDFMTPALEVVFKVSGRRYTPEDFPTWDLFDTIPKEYEDAAYSYFESPGFCANLQPYPGAVEGLDALSEYFEIFALTSPLKSKHWMYERSHALSKHFGIKHNHQIHTSAKYTVMGDVFIDDNPRHIKEWSDTNRIGMPVLWDHPYNRNVPINITRPWIRTNDWEKVLGHAERLGITPSNDQ